MTTIRAPKTLAAATALLERYAGLQGELLAVEGARGEGIAKVNAAADALAGPLLEQSAAIHVKLQAWWSESGKGHAGKRKSIELGGCLIGSVQARAKLKHAFETDEAAIEALRASRYGKQTTGVKYTLDRAATLKLLQVDGAPAKKLEELGFAVDKGGETFFIKRAEQQGTLAAA